MRADYDIEFEGKRYKKEEFIYRPWEEPSNKRMKYCSAFYSLWVREGDVKMGKVSGKMSSRSLWTQKFVPFFNRLYKTKKNKKEPITWNDFKELTL
jgi:hypothetical protein